MTEHRFPAYVDRFTKGLQSYLDRYEVTLDLTLRRLDEDQPSLEYEITGAPWTPILILHQTARSLEWPEPEYRVRLGTTLPDELANWIRGKENLANRYASIAAVISSQTSVDVVCQSLLTDENADLTAYMMSIAAMYGAMTITESIKLSLQKNEEQVDVLSQWTDFDFEQIHYDYAHLGVGRIAHRNWSMRTFHGHLNLSANDNNPYWKAGILSLASFSKQQLGMEDSENAANELNQMAFLLDDTPMYGAWCDYDNEQLVFVTFIPNFMKDLPDITEYLVKWFMQRIRSVHTLIRALNDQDT